MATDKVMITISGLQDHEVILASDSQSSVALHQVDLFRADGSLPEAPARPEVQSPDVISKAPPEAVGAAVGERKPWEVASGEPTAINFRPDMSLHAKMEWVCENVPRMSRLRILREGASLLCNQLIDKHHRSQD